MAVSHPLEGIVMSVLIPFHFNGALVLFLAHVDQLEVSYFPCPVNIVEEHVISPL